jgi:hypothetical protein
LSVARWRSSSGMNEWMCAKERLNPEVASIFGAAARYRRATVGSSHDDAHPDNSSLHTGGSPPHRLCGGPFLHMVPYGPWQFASVRNASSFFVNFWSCACRAGDDASMFFRGLVEAEGGTSVAAPASWLFWNLMPHPLLVEEDSTSPPR